jgi:hypothetical protein
MLVLKSRNYLGNPKLKKIGIDVSLTQAQVEEFIRCSEDPIYFIQNYVKIITLDQGFIQINLYEFQKQVIELMHNERQVIVKAGRQVGKTTVIVGYLIWYIIFNQDKTVAILANKAKTAREILSRIKLAYEALPLWIQQGVKTWNKGDIELENNCRIMADSTASSAIRGYSISLLYLDEFAFVPTNIAEEFFTSVYPTISSGKTSKILISSTPKGMNHFYKMWTEAENGVNNFKTFEANWRDVPGRNQAWAEDQRAALGEDKFLQEIECQFLGSAGTLISSTALKAMTFTDSMKKVLDGMDIHESVEENHTYVLVADTARGNGLDSSAFVVVDVSQKPYKVVAKYKNNFISPLLFPNVIAQAGRYYNDAYLLIENNDTGGQVADTLYHDLEYENMFFTEQNRGNLQVSERSVRTMGVRTTKKVKSLGCNAIKSLIEKYELIITDFEIIEELSCFILKRNGTYAAEDGKHDDLVMCLVLFAWLSTQSFFRDLTDVDVRKRLFEHQMNEIENQLVAPVFSTKQDEFENKYGIVDAEMTREDGDVWFVADKPSKTFII